MSLKIVIPTHYADSAVKYEVPQADLSVFMKEMGISEYEAQDSLKLKESELGEKTTVVVLNRIQIKKDYQNSLLISIAL